MRFGMILVETYIYYYYTQKMSKLCLYNILASLLAIYTLFDMSIFILSSIFLLKSGLSG